MSEFLKLNEILRGHEGMTLYSPVFGECVLHKIIDTNNNGSHPLLSIKLANNTYRNIAGNGKLDWSLGYYGKVIIFPSREQQDWDEWIAENSVSAKTWDDVLTPTNSLASVCLYFVNNKDSNKEAKSAQALLKIRAIITAFYGGNPTIEEKEITRTWQFVRRGGEWDVVEAYESIDPIAFYEKEQALNFISNPKNVVLLNDFYI